MLNYVEWQTGFVSRPPVGIFLESQLAHSKRLEHSIIERLRVNWRVSGLDGDGISFMLANCRSMLVAGAFAASTTRCNRDASRRSHALKFE